MSLSKKAVRKPTTVLILFILLTILGVYATMMLPIDLLPDMDIPYIMVSTSYSNASPEEVEDKITKTLESSLSSVTGLKTLSSTSSQGSSLIVLEFNVDTNLDEASNTIRDRIDLVRNYLPEDADSPVIFKLDPSMMPLGSIAVYSDNKTPDEIKKITEDTIQPRIEQLDGVASTFLTGGRKRIIRVEIPRDRLDAYNLTFASVAQMIGAQNLNSAAGSITENGIEYTIQTEGDYANVDQIGDTVIAYKPKKNGQLQQITLSEVGTVTDDYEDASTYAIYNGAPCVALSISKQTGKNTVAVAKTVRESLPKIQKALPSDVKLVMAYDSSEVITDSISQVSTSAYQGAILAVIVLIIFLRSVRSTLIVSLSIPISIIITLMLMYFCGFSLNLMTLAGLALGVGMLVDNSIVIIENIYSYRERGSKPTVAAILGSQEMVSAITSSTLTTICVFLPLIMFQKKLGMIGEVFQGLSFSVVFSLVSSLVVAITLVPVLASKYLVPSVKKDKDSKGLNKLISHVFDAMDNGYAHAVRWILHHKTLLFIVLIALLVFCGYEFKRIGTTYMPEQAQTSMTVTIQLPKGTAIEEVKSFSERFNNDVMSKVTGIKDNLLIMGSGMTMMSGGDSATATAMYMLYSSAERTPEMMDDKQITAVINEIKGNYPEATITVSEGSATMSVGGSSGIDVKIASTDLDAVRLVAGEVQQMLESQCKDIVRDVDSSMEEGLPQLSIIYDRDKMYSLGITVAQANNEIKANIDGMTASRFSDAGTNVNIVLSVPKSDKASTLDIENIMVSSPTAGLVPLSAIARIVETRAPLAINREDQSRVIHITAKGTGTMTLDKLQKEVERRINANVPSEENVIISYSGDYEDMMTALTSFAQIIAVAILLVFAIMASQFESFSKPFIVLFTMPLSIIGVVLIYTITGEVFNVITAVGLLILVGIIVNNGIVLVDYIGLMQKRGYKLEDACVMAAKSRLRPILMTTLTTILALVPMAFFPGEGSEMVMPIGQTVLGGLGFGTIMTLFLMPVMYYIFNYGKEKRSLKRLAKERENAEKLEVLDEKA